MRYKAMFVAGFAVGFVAGARSGRETYDKMMQYAQQVAEHPKVQQATSVAQAKATELAKTAREKGPDYAKNAASSAASMAQGQAAQVPKYLANVKQAASSRMPSRRNGDADAGPAGTVTETLDDVDQDGNLVYPAEGSPSVNATIRHYTTETPEEGA
jgi:hypothetical protein